MPSGSHSLRDLPNIFTFDEKFFIVNKKTRKISTVYRGEISEEKNNHSIFFEKDAKIYCQQLTNQTFVILNNKIYQVSYKDNKIKTQFITQYDSFDTDQIISIFYDDKYKKLYLGSSTKGLNILPVNNFYTSKDNSKYADNVYYAFLPFGKNSVITEGGIIYDRYGIIGKKKFEKNPYKRLLIYDEHSNIIYSKYSTIIRHLKSSDYQRYDSITSDRSFKSLKSIGNKLITTYYHDPKTSFLGIYNQNSKKEFELKMAVDGNTCNH